MYRSTEDREEWLNAPVRLDIGLECDADFEYTLNVTYPAYLWEEYECDYQGMFDRSSIMWLTRRQGYKQKELRKAQHLIDDKYILRGERQRLEQRTYLKSAAREIWHEMSIFNQLGFFIKVPLRDYLLLETLEYWYKKTHKWHGYIMLGTSVTCGFYCTWEGSCSLLGIKLEKPVKVPLWDVSFSPDTAHRYPIYNVCSDPGVWREGCITYWGLPRQFRRDAAALGVAELPPKREKNGETSLV